MVDFNNSKIRRRKGFIQQHFLFKKVRAGFTLIEVMMVVVIIGILATALGWGAYRNSIKKSRDGRRKADLQQIRSGLEMYRADMGSYPPTGSIGCDGTLSAGGATYISPIPCDPQYPDSEYVYSGGGTAYSITATLEMGDTYKVYNP